MIVISQIERRKLAKIGTIVMYPGSLSVYVEICKFIDRGEIPKIRTLAESLGMNVNGITGHLKRLKKAGFISYISNHAGTIRPLYRIEIFPTSHSEV